MARGELNSLKWRKAELEKQFDKLLKEEASHPSHAGFIQWVGRRNALSIKIANVNYKIKNVQRNYPANGFPPGAFELIQVIKTDKRF